MRLVKDEKTGKKKKNDNNGRKHSIQIRNMKEIREERRGKKTHDSN